MTHESALSRPEIRDSICPMDLRHFLRLDDKWDILLDRGLDIWQRFDSNDAFSMEGRMPEMRRVKAFEVTYMKIG